MHWKAMIDVDLLTRYYGKTPAVQQVSFSIDQRQIVGLLGHNGAGKTTAIYMLTGMHKTTSGDAIIYNNRITKDIHKVQQNLGLCQ